MDSVTDSRSARVRQWLRARLGTFLSVAVICVGIFQFGKFLHGHYPIQHWLFFRYVGYWIGTLFVGAASYGLGHVVLQRMRTRMPLYEHAIVALALGIFSFELLMFALGLARLYNKVTFFALPPILCIVLAPQLYRHAKRIHRVYERMRHRHKPLGMEQLALAFGLLSLAMIYFCVLTPQNIQFDARFKHMALAEQFVVTGGIRPSVEGWVFTARPHFTSFLYTWAFLSPGRLFDKVELAAHIEFFLFLATTVVGIPALVRKLVPRIDPRWIWAIRFTFPGVMLYDSSVSGGADHVGAFFAVALAICLLRVLRDLDLRYSVLLGIFLAAAALTKETVAIMLVPVPCLILVVRAIVVAIGIARKKESTDFGKRWLLAPVIAGSCALVFSAPLWGTNWAFYGDPWYPLLSAKLHPHPFTDQAAYRMKYGYLGEAVGMWAPKRDLAGLKRTIFALYDFSFNPNDWPRFHRNVPVIGSLFTLLLPCILFLGKQKRTWLLIGWVHVAIFAWYSVSHQDRYLQALMPLMTATTAAIAVLVWRKFGKAAQVALVMLFGLQIVWGGDVYFIQTHPFVKSPLKQTIDLLSAGFDRKYAERFAMQDKWQQVGEATPKGSKILMHLPGRHHSQLGSNRENVLDAYYWQFGIEYGAAGSPEGVRKMLHGLGVTHVYAAPDKESESTDSIAADILFWEFVKNGIARRKTIGDGVLGELPSTPMTAPWADAVAVLTCTKRGPRSGLYRVADLRALPYGPNARKFGRPIRDAATTDAAIKLVASAHSVVLEDGCTELQKGADLSKSFDLIVQRRAYEEYNAMDIYSRRAGSTPAPL